MQIIKKLKTNYSSFWANFVRLWHASKTSTILLILLEIFLGSVAVIELAILSHLIDSTIGARSIGVWTSDISLGLRNQILLFIGVVIALHLKEQFQGLTAKIGATIREIVFIIIMFITSLVASPVLLTASVISYVVVLQTDRRIWRVLFSFAAIAIGASGLSTILHLAVQKDISIGELIWWGGAAMALTGWLALAPHIGQTPGSAPTTK